VRVHRVVVENPEQSRGAPGLLLDSSRDVVISETRFSTGSGDAILIQSGRGWLGRKVSSTLWGRRNVGKQPINSHLRTKP
jgi:polygalacturonase